MTITVTPLLLLKGGVQNPRRLKLLGGAYSMRCLKCWKQITMDNRQKFKAGLRLPYCRDCVQTYIAVEKLSKLHSAQRKEYVKETKDNLKAMKKDYTEEDVEDAERKLKVIGFTDEEIDYILEALK